MNPSLQRLHRSAMFVTVFAVAVILAGAVITSAEVAARQSESAVSMAIADAGLHRYLAMALTLLALALAIWTSRSAVPRWLPAAAWAGAVALALDAVLGWADPPLSPGIAVFHALLAHLFLSLLCAVALGTSASWNREPELVDGSKKPLLRPAALATPPVVFLQITLGSAYRHDLTSIMPHMAIAMGVAFLALIASSVVLQNFPKPASLRRAAGALLAFVLTQVCLGIASFLMLVLNSAGTYYFVLTTAAHVAVGAGTLAASLIMAMEVWRSVDLRPNKPLS